MAWSGGVEFAGPAERAEQFRYGAVVLLGQDLGGCEQGRLPAVVDDLEHRPDGDQGLAGAHFALQQGVHRMLPAQRRVISSPASRWPWVSENGSRASNASSSPPRRGIRGVAGSASSARRRWASTDWSTNASSHFSRSLAGSISAYSTGRWMPCQAASLALQPVAGAHLGGQRVVGDIERVQHGPDRLGDLPGRHLPGGRVHRDDLGRVLFGHLGARVRRAQQLAVGVDELALAPVRGHLAGEQAVQPGLHLLLPPRLPEERQSQRPAAIGDGHLGELPAPVLHPPAGDGGDLGQHRDVLAVAQRGQVGQLTTLLVAARVVPQQLAHGVHVQRAGQDFGRLRVELPVERVIKPRHGLTG